MTQEEYRCKLKAANCNADMNTAFQIMADYIDTLEALVPKWHPFIEGKSEPSESDYYLTVQRVGKYATIVITEHWVAVPGYWDTKAVITHWMPVPEPPEKEK